MAIRYTAITPALGAQVEGFDVRPETREHHSARPASHCAGL